jgi:hypothetical protein
LGELSGKGAIADDTELSGPCFADDGQTLYFSRSRPGQRADIVSSQVTEEGWSKPTLVRELNSVDDDRRLTMSADGGVAALASNRSGGHGGFDIYESVRSNDRWSRPRNAGAAINTEAEEFDPALAPDGLTMYFVRVVPGTSADLYVTRREKLDAAWSSAQLVEMINSPDHHERSPAVSPDGSWLLFASNRGDRAGESAPFGLFRAPLRDGHIGAAERLRDGIASDSDDVDGAFAADGRSLLFVSKREGAKQIFLSHAEYVVPQLSISLAHLAPFGPREWMLPILVMLVLIVVIRWALRAPLIEVVEAPKTATIAAPLRRSELPKNPLQAWTVAPPEKAPSPTPVVNPLMVAKAAEPNATGPTVTAPADAAPSRPLRWAALVVAAAAAIAFVVLRPEQTDQTISIPPTAPFELSSEFAQLSEISPPRAEEFPKLERANTARSDAPQPIAPPSHLVALRPGARWPTDRVIVRQRSEVVREGEVDQRLLNLRKATALARQPIPTSLSRPTERPGEPITLAAVPPSDEKPHSLAATTTNKQAFDPSSAERTGLKPVTSNQAVLGKPVARREPLAAASPPMLQVSSRDSLARSGAATRGTIPSHLTESEAMIGPNTAVAGALEAPLPAQSVALARTESTLVSQPTQLSTPQSLVRRVQPSSTQPPNLAVTSEVASPAKNLNDARLPAKSGTAPTAVPLTEEVKIAAPTTSSGETSAVTPTTALLRGETSGPLPTLPATPHGLASTRAELSTLRTTSPLDAAERTLVTPKMTILARRETFAPATISIAAVDLASGMGTPAPALLLTSATMLVELLTSAPLPALPRADSGNPATSIPVQPPSQLLPGLSRALVRTKPNDMPAATEPSAVISKPLLPRRSRETSPAELVETISAAP